MKYISLWYNRTVQKLQDSGHDVYWFENGWYHSDNCQQCRALLTPSPSQGEGRDEGERRSEANP